MSFKIFFFVDLNIEFRVDNKLCLFVILLKLFLFLIIFFNLGVRLFENNFLVLCSKIICISFVGGRGVIEVVNY